ncbi:hypothetical protein [Paenibacillus sp. S150]|uniref:hypothetical protein n=1 Tax=Paenibacillus sp. S150 TaxID=2749826 RepID=UPI001C5600F9|nr:hypothetical protein [Paenibacillus sp. S150]MBW4083601.1 hypothetical protein [Paenibacillus sp. S150]
MSKRVYLSAADIEAFELMETCFNADAANTGDYTAEEVEAVRKLASKITGEEAQ